MGRSRLSRALIFSLAGAALTSTVASATTLGSKPTTAGKSIAQAVVLRASDVPGWTPLSRPGKPPALSVCRGVYDVSSAQVNGQAWRGFREQAGTLLRSVASKATVFATAWQASRFTRTATAALPACLATGLSGSVHGGVRGQVAGRRWLVLPSSAERAPDFQLHMRLVSAPGGQHVGDAYFETAFLRQGRTVVALQYVIDGPSDHNGMTNFANTVAARMRQHA